ncbi:MAG: hypothetical protein EPO45_17640 [Sphingobium sp.]|nr:MAG: hypothetical protein EPO45_17640 [Sphingobium sp.]
MAPMNGIAWIDCREQRPPLPSTPYELYLVWVVQLHEDATGTSALWQFSREDNDWLPLPNGPTGAAQIITHYSEALRALGSPLPKPHGPRGKEYMKPYLVTR